MPAWIATEGGTSMATFNAGRDSGYEPDSVAAGDAYLKRRRNIPFGSKSDVSTGQYQSVGGAPARGISHQEPSRVAGHDGRGRLGVYPAHRLGGRRQGQ